MLVLWASMITAVLLVEFASTSYPLLVDALRSSYIFASTLKKEDWVAVVSYDMRPDILVDFTQDKNAVMGGLNTLRMPGFSETNLFDALYDTLDRLDRVEGHKYVILVSTGIDTFSNNDIGIFAQGGTFSGVFNGAFVVNKSPKLRPDPNPATAIDGPPTGLTQLHKS